MTTRPTPNPAIPAAAGLRPGTRALRSAAGLRGRALIAGLGLAVAAAVLPATAAHAAPQPPGVETHFANPGGNPQPPEPPDPPELGPQDLANPTENPEPPLPPDPPDWGPDDLANPTENPEPPLPPEPPGDDPIPTPERVDAGLGGAAAGPHQAAGLALIAAALMLALLLVVIARRHRSDSGRSR